MRGNSWFVIVLLAGCGYSQAQNSVVSTLPATTQINVAFYVTNVVTAAEGVGVYAVEDEVPAGWMVDEISHGGRFDSGNRKAKWGPFFDWTPRTLVYRVTPSANALGVAEFVGQGAFDGVLLSITGNRQTTVIPTVPASRVECSLPIGFLPGTSLFVTNLATPATNISVYSVEDQIPMGWAVANLSHGGQWDAAQRKVKWGPFFDTLVRPLSYQLLTPPTATGEAALTGVGAFDSLNVPITGQRTTVAVVSTALRSLPAHHQPDILLSVSITVTPSANVAVQAVEDTVPAGWTVSGINEGGVFDAANRVVKWGPYFDHDGRTLSYQVRPPLNATGVVTFGGRSSFDGFTVPVAGGLQSAAIISSIVSDLPGEFLPGIGFTVTNRVSADPNVQLYAVEDAVPVGWVVSDISDGGDLDAVSHTVKWGPYFDNSPRVLNYRVTPPSGTSGQAVFSGRGSFDGLTVVITGRRTSSALEVGEANRIIRWLPLNTRSGRDFMVTNKVVVAANISVYAIEDQIPTGWIVSLISHGGTYDSGTRKVKWGPFFDQSQRDLTYTILVPNAAAGSYAFAGIGSFDGRPVAVGGRTSLIAVSNHSPVAHDDDFQRFSNLDLSIPLANLFGNDSDADGDSLTLSAVSSISPGGATITVINDVLVYSPPAGFNAADTFTYTISDGFGGSAAAMVTVTVPDAGPGSNIKSLLTLPDGSVRLRFGGIPGRPYLIQATDTFSPPAWITLGSQTAGINGEFEFVDTAAAGHPTRFYRSATP